MQTIILPEKPKIIKKEKSRAVFEIKPLFPGYGATLGNALRRVLLSSLPGAAITSVKIAGVSHEFSTIPHIMEDVVEIILNLKQLRFKMYSEKPVKIYLKVKGEKEVKAEEIKISSSIEIVNKDAHIATLTNKKASLEMEMLLEKGLGYLPVEQRTETKLPIGTIAIDALFTPVRKVSYDIENMRVGKMTNYNKLTLEIETDGTISPEDAFKSAVDILVDHFSLLSGILKTPEIRSKENDFKEEVEEETNKKEKKEKEENTLLFEVTRLNIPIRVVNILKTNRIKTIGSLVKKKEESLAKIEGLGPEGIKNIKRELSKLGLTLKS